jgi:hypothetical protein
MVAHRPQCLRAGVDPSKSSATDGFLNEVVSAFIKAYIETVFKVCHVLRKNKKGIVITKMKTNKERIRKDDNIQNDNMKHNNIESHNIKKL